MRAPSLFSYVRSRPADDPGDADALIECPECRTVQPLAEFYVKRARERLAELGELRDGRRVCRDCTSRAAREYRQPRVDIVDAAVASGCVDCGLVDSAHPEIFDFDHVRPGKVKTVSRWLTSGSIQDLLDEIARCEVVCSNCHRIRTRKRVSGKRGNDSGKRRLPQSPSGSVTGTRVVILQSARLEGLF